VNVSIFGLGYVGTVTAACLTRYGHTVIGVDPNDFKTGCINSGNSPIVEPGLDELLRQGVESHRLSATENAEKAVLATDLSLVCVGTPSNQNGSLDLDYVWRVAEQLGKILKKKSTFHGVVIRSTVLPGTVEEVARRIEEASGKKHGEGFGIASNPEFLREGTSVYDFDNPPYTVVGTANNKMRSLLNDLYQKVSAPIHFVQIREAELLKYACNAYHAVKVAFANEIGSIAKELSIDSHAVMNIFCEDTKLNISAAYLKPGFAFGGSCLPKDVRAITHEARTLDLETPLLTSLIPSNDYQIQRAVDWVIGQGKKKIGILGLSFKSDTDDMRESPIVRMVETLVGKGYDISIYDSNVSLSRVLGANRSYIEQEIPHISTLLKEEIDQVLSDAEVVVVANRGAEFAPALSEISDGVAVLDLVRILDPGQQPPSRYEGVAW